MTSKRSDTLRTWFGRIPSWCFTRMDQWTWFHGLGLDPLKPTSPSPGGTPSYHKWRGQRNPPKRASLQGLYISWKTSVSTQSCHFEHGFEDFFVWSTNHQKNYEKYHLMNYSIRDWKRFWGSLAPPFFHEVWWTRLSGFLKMVLAIGGYPVPSSLATSSLHKSQEIRMNQSEPYHFGKSPHVKTHTNAMKSL